MTNFPGKSAASSTNSGILDQLLANTMDFVLAIDRNGLIVAASRSILVCLGSKAPSVIGRPWQEFLEPLGKGKDAEKLFRSGTPDNGKRTFYLLAITGGKLPVSINWSPCRYGRKKVWMLVGGPCQEPLPGENPQSSSDEFLHPERHGSGPIPEWVPDAWGYIARAIPLPIALIALDGQFSWGNAAFRRTFLSYPPPGFNHFKDLGSFIPGFQFFLERVQRGETVEMPGKWVNPGLKVPGAPSVDLFLQGILCPCSNHNGVLQGYVLITHPVGELRRRDEALIESEERCRAATESLAEGLLIIDSHGIITTANNSAARVVALDQEQLVGMPFSSIGFRQMTDEGNDSTDLGMDWEALLKASILNQNMNLFYQNDNGCRTLLSCRLASLHSQINRATHEFLFTMRNVTDEVRNRKMLEANEKSLGVAKEAAETANLSKTQFLIMVSHELKTPMVTLLGYGELLAKMGSSLTPDSIVDFGSRIVESTSHLQNLVDGILYFASIDAGQFSFNLRRVNFTEELDFVRAYGNSLAAQKGLVFELHGLEGPVWGHTDPHIFAQVLTCLLGNAFKFTQKGKVTVHIQDLEGKIKLQISDTGIGISKHEKKKIFEPFYQASAGLTRRFGGLGLGLAISNRIIKKMGGTLEVSSIQGNGTTVTLLLPDVTSEKGS
ncbi:MAG: PAS domain S-box protein [Candidatus Riflebacteria bacterium]|nr:PAS domain S-box protein [Candidatus Riflebacteria bacterium]